MNNLRSFTDGRLTAEQEDKFLRKIVGAQTEQERRQRWANKLSQEHGLNRQQTLRPQKSKIRQFLVYGASIAAVLLIGIFFMTNSELLGGNSSQVLAGQYLESTKIPYSVTKKGMESNALQLRIQLADAYNLNQYARVLSIGQKIAQTTELTNKDLFFIGLSHLFLQQHEQAITFLSKAREGEIQTEDLNQETNWFLSLAYLMSNQNESGRTYLLRIQPGQWHYAEAQALLEKLD